jgi:hypothetical protein
VHLNKEDLRVEGELFDEETEQWFSLPHAQSALGPGRTHAATTSCRMLNVIGSSSRSPGSTSKGGGGLAGARGGGSIASMMESTDKVIAQHCRQGWIVS